MSITTHLDQRPLELFHWRVTLLAGLCVMFSAMNLMLIDYLLAGLSQRWNLGPDQIHLVVETGLAGMVAGAVLAGVLADRFGRRPVLIGSLVLGAVGAGLVAIAPGLPGLLVARGLAGLGLGGGLPVASSLAAEIAPTRRRGLVVGLVVSAWGGGLLLAALVGLWVVPRFGWVAGSLAGGLPALIGLVLRRWLPESPRFLVRAGRLSEAAALLRRMGLTPTGQQLQGVAPGRIHGLLSRLRRLWQPKLARWTLLLWLLWAGLVQASFGITVWLPPLLADRGLPVVQQLGGTLVVMLAAVPGALSAAWLGDQASRKWTLVGCLALVGVTALLWSQLGLVTGAPASHPIAWWAMAQFVSLGAWAGLITITTERYPTDLRATATGSAAATGWFGSLAGLVVTLWLLDPAGPRLDPRLVMGLFGLTGLALAGVAAVFGEETRDQSLEQLTGEERPVVPASQRWVS